jgi:hypothetical protein
VISERSYETITKSHLRRLANLAAQDREDFFGRYPRWRRLYSRRYVCTALCQGAALHYVDGKTGVKDFDVWTFYSASPTAPFPYRRTGHIDFGRSQFGTHPADARKYKGRRIDCLGRSLHCSSATGPVHALRTYLSESRTKSARLLSQKAVVLLHPSKLCGKVVWPE